MRWDFEASEILRKEWGSGKTAASKLSFASGGSGPCRMDSDHPEGLWMGLIMPLRI